MLEWRGAEEGVVTGEGTAPGCGGGGSIDVCVDGIATVREGV
jgi:hypothetical protein